MHTRFWRAIGRIARESSIMWWAPAALAIVLAAPREAEAQFNSPRVRILPQAGEYAKGDSVVVRVQFCSRYRFDTSTEEIKVNGVQVSYANWPLKPILQTDCSYYARERESKIALSVGPTTIFARIENDPNGDGNSADDGMMGQASVTHTVPYPPYLMELVGQNRFLEVAPGAVRSEQYRVTNRGGETTTFSATCTWSLGACSSTPSSITLAPDSAGSFTVGFTAGTAGTTGLLSFNVSGGAGPAPASASEWIEVAAIAPSTAAGLRLVNATGTVERDLCLTIAAGPAAAFECGDLRLSHALPTVTTKGKARTPTLVYNSTHAQPNALIGVDLTLPSGFNSADTVTASMVVVAGPSHVGSALPAGKWLASDWPTGGGTRRIVASVAGETLSTGKYDYRLEVRRNSVAQPDTVRGSLLHVNRAFSRYHAGWWLAGNERLFASVGGLMWVGGDGSARFYADQGSCLWRAENVERPDSISGDCSTTFVRQLPNGLKVVFDAAGLHRFTVNRLGDTTRFHYNAAQFVDSIVVPPAGAGLKYVFHYGATTGMLDSVSAPGPMSSSPRRTRLTYVAGPPLPQASGHRLLSIRDPDSSLVQFHYANETAGQGDYRIVSRVDRRNVTTTFTYDAGNRPTQSSTPANATQTVAQQFRAAEVVGLGATPAIAGRAALVDSAYSRLDGPRTDVPDVSKWWLNRFGSPVRTRDPVGLEMRIAYDATWPALPKRVTSAARLTSEAFYNARGLADSSKVYAPFGTASDTAVTRYVWHAIWDMPTQVTNPVEVVSRQGYDANGNTIWSAVGSDTTHFSYDATTKQLIASRAPGITRSDSIAYDALGNVRRSVSPTGIWALAFKDGLGRDTLVVTPIDSAADTTLVQRQRILYDLSEQVIETITSAPAKPYTLLSGTTTSDTMPVQADTIIVRNAYDAEGNVVRVQKLSKPDPAPYAGCDAPVGLCEGIAESDSGSVDLREFDNLGRLTRQRLGSGGGTYQYDLAGNVVQRSLWSGAVIQTAYDPAGRSLRSWFAARQTSQELCANRPETPMIGSQSFCLVRFPFFSNISGGGLEVPADTSRFQYDAAGNMVRAINRFSIITRRHHPNGALKADTLNIKSYARGRFDSNVYGLQYGYDLAGRRTSLTLPSNVQSGNITYEYDPVRGDLMRVSFGAHSARFTYDRAGRQDSVKISNGTTLGIWEVRGYDDDGQLLTRERRTGSNAVLQRDTLRYDARGKVMEARIFSAVPDVASTTTINRYSGLGAVVAQQRRVNGQNLRWELEEFRTSGAGDVFYSDSRRMDEQTTLSELPVGSTYSPIGALIARRPHRSYVIDGDSVYTDTLYTHLDNSGNVLRTGEAKRDRFGDVTFQTAGRNWYDGAGKLRYLQRYAQNGTGVSAIRTGTWEEIRYDALGRRILTRARRDSSALCAGTNVVCESYVERTIWDGDDILFELRAKGEDSISTIHLDNHFSTGYDRGKVGYVHAGSIDKPIFTMDGRVAHYNWRGLPEASSWTNGANADCTLIGDGSPCTKVNWPGATGVYFRGAPAPGGGGPLPQWVGTLLANGGGSSGMLYRRNRFYDPATGQFNQQDPIGLAGGANTYGFTGGDPINHSDPFGLCRLRPCLVPRLGQFAGAAARTGSDRVVVGASVTAGNVSVSQRVGSSEPSVSIPLNSSSYGASLDLGVKLRTAAEGEPRGSVSLGLGKHSGITVDNESVTLNLGVSTPTLLPVTVAPEVTASPSGPPPGVPGIQSDATSVNRTAPQPLPMPRHTMRAPFPR